MNRLSPCLLLVLLTACGGRDRAAFAYRQDTAQDFLTVCAQGGTLPGLDVSSYQGSINWGQVAGSGIKWAYAKATEGTGFRDATFPGNWSGMKSAGVARGAYHFFHPGISGTQQADYFLAYVGALGPGDLPPMLDWEVSDGVSGATASANAQAFIDEIAARTGMKTVIYTSPGLWSGFGASGFGSDPLWVAEYYNCYCNAGVCPQMPGGWSNWTFWQYSDRGNVPGISGGVDLDEFNGDAAALAAFAGGGAACSNPSAIGHPVGAGGAVSGACGGGAPVPTAPTACGAIPSGQGLGPGQSVASCDGRFVLAMQTDGNLVLYSNGNPLFATHTDGNGGAAAVMQGDGNLVVYSASGCPLWASKTASHPGASLAIQDDGNLVIYGSGAALWSSGTGPIGAKPSGCGAMQAGAGLAPGESVVACGGCFTLVMQADGNLVLYQNGGGALWSTRSGGTDGYAAAMQSDGDLVLYGASGCPVWSSQTGGHAGATLAVQDDGNLVLYDQGTAIWNSGSVACQGGCTCNAPSTTTTSSSGTTSGGATSGGATSGSSTGSASTGGTAGGPTSESTTGTGGTSAGSTGVGATSGGATSGSTASTEGTSAGSTGAGAASGGTGGSAGTPAASLRSTDVRGGCSAGGGGGELALLALTLIVVRRRGRCAARGLDR